MMRKIERVAIIVAALALALPGTAAAQTSGAALIAAGDQVRGKLAKAAKGAAPSLKNADAALVRRVFDSPTIRKLPLTLEIGDICIAVGSTIVAYTEYATRVTAGEPNPPAAAGTAPISASDALLMTLQDEMALGGEAANVCVQRGFRAVTITLAGMPAERRSGATGALKQMRDGAVQTIEGTLASATQPGVKPANRSKMIGSTLEDAAELAASFPAGERAAMRQKVLTFVAKATPATSGQITALANAFATSKCNLLCQTAGTF